MTLHRFAVFTALLTFALLLVGGLVSGTGSGLACPEPWFVCKGSMLPEMTGGVLFEHGHRLWAMAVGLCLTIIAFVSWLKRHEDPRRFKLGLLLFGLVCAQGAFGAATVAYKLHPVVATSHLTLGITTFSAVVYFAWTTRPSPAPRLVIGSGTRAWLVASLVLTMAQIMLGGWVRHTGSGSACQGDVPLCAGKVWDGLHWTAQTQVVHRMMALVVAAVVLTTAVKLWKHTRGQGGAHLLTQALPFILVVQIVLGILSVTSVLGLVQVTAHLGFGVLLLQAGWLLVLSTRAQPVVAPESTPVLAAMQVSK